MKFPISRTDLYKELLDLGYAESTRIDSPNQVLLTENRGIARNTITLKGSGVTAMPGLTNQNPSIVVKSATEIVTYNVTYPKTSALMLDAGLVDDIKLDQYITASGIDKSLFIDTSLYSIEVTSEGSIKVNFTDIFDEGLILLPLVDGNAYQLDQLDKLGAAADPVLRFATGKSFTKANVLANRKLVPGKTNTYFLPLVLKVTAVGEFPNFTVNAVEPNQSLVNYLALGPNEISNAALTVGWLGVNAITDTQFRPSLASPLNVDLAIRQFKVPAMPLSYASVAIIDALKVNVANAAEVISYNDYTSTLTGASGESRTINIVYNEDYDKTKKQVLQVYTLPITDASALSETVTAGDFDVLRVNNVPYKASEVIDRIIEDSGKFFIGFPLTITDMPITTTFSLNVGGLNNPNTEWVETNWVTTVTQVIPQELVIPVTKLANKFVKKLSDVDGGFKSGIKHMRVEFDVPANQEFAYGYSDKTNLTILDESVEGLFEVVKPVSTVAIVDQTLTDGTIIKNMTDSVATLRLYIQVPMTSVNQSIGSNYLVESQVTAGAVFDLANSKIKANGDYIFLKSQTANTTIDTLGYSHRYQRLIGKDQAIQFKYNSVMAQSVSFGSAGPLDHTDVTNFQSSVVSANQTKVLMTSDGYIYTIDETGFNQIDRLDLREGVYIEAAVDSAGTGLIVTQYQYANDDLTKKPFILNINELPNILAGITGGISVHVSAVQIAKDVEVYLTDIYNVVKVVPAIECAGSTNTFVTNVENSSDATVQINDADTISWVDWKEEYSLQVIDGVLTVVSPDFELSTRIRIRKLAGFLTEAQVAQANTAIVIYDKFGNVIDTALESNYVIVNTIKGIRYAGLDVCLAKSEYPDVDLTDALMITNPIAIDGHWNAKLNGSVVGSTDIDYTALKTALNAAGSDVVLHVLDDIDTTGALPVTEPIDMQGKWFIMYEGKVISNSDMTLEELQAFLLTKGIQMQIN